MGHRGRVARGHRPGSPLLHDRGAPAVLEELRITRFTSFRDAVMSLDDLTLLIGRNGSGKSNALEALELRGRDSNPDSWYQKPESCR